MWYEDIKVKSSQKEKQAKVAFNKLPEYKAPMGQNIIISRISTYFRQKSFRTVNNRIFRGLGKLRVNDGNLPFLRGKFTGPTNTKSDKARAIARKLAPKWLGPYQIKSKVGRYQRTRRWSMACRPT